MSDTDFDKSLQLTLAHEGGYVNNPKDPGGATNKGVTQAVYDNYRASKNLPKQTVRLIGDDEVRDLYKNRYWNLAKCDALPCGIDYATFDYSVNSGVGKAVKDLQRTVNDFADRTKCPPLKVDGIGGDDTVAYVKKAYEVDPATFIEAYCDRRMSFLKSLKNYATFGKGWKRRVIGDMDGAQDGDSGVVDYAVAMSKGANAPMAGTLATTSVEIAAATPVGQPIPASALPAPIGAKAGEVPAKGFGSQQALWKTAQGLGAALGAAGVTGQTVLGAADTAKSHINATVFGQVALLLFLLLMIAGIGLIVANFLKVRREKGA